LRPPSLCFTASDIEVPTYIVFLRFLLTGGTTTIVNFCIFIGLTDLHLHYLIASSVAWLTTICLSFALNKWFTFSSNENPVLPEAGKFFFVYIMQFAIASAAYVILIGFLGLSPFQAFVINLVVLSTFSFCLLRVFVFPQSASIQHSSGREISGRGGTAHNNLDCPELPLRMTRCFRI
jgi:putative flippase GtrA